MNWRPDRYAGLRRLVRGPRVAEEVLEEFEHHLEERIAANVRRGMSAEAAREDALRRFGDMERLRRETAAIDESMIREQKRMEVFDSFRRELRQSGRGLVRARGFSIVAVVTLALGIGAASAVFTLLKNVVLDPLPYPEADRLVSVRHAVPGVAEDAEWGMASASYFHFRERARSLDALALYHGWTENVRAAGDASLTEIVRASPAAFELLGARAIAGRLFLEEEGQPGGRAVALLAHGYWQREYGGADAVGTVLNVGGSSYDVVGVLPEDFAFPGIRGEVYLPLRMNPAGPHYNSHYLSSIGRLRAGASVAALEAELQQLTPQLVEAYPTVYSERFMEQTKFAPVVRELRAEVVDFDIARTLWVLLGSVAVVLLIACANVANLFLVRSESRVNELAVRRAMGAERAHLFLQSLTEALLLTVTAGALGIWLGHGALRLLIALAPTSLPRLDEVELGGATIGAALVMAVLCALTFALFPLLRRSTTDYAPLREAGRGLTASRRQLRVRSALVAGQIALALVLLASAGLMLRSFQRMRSVELGFQPERVLTLQVALPYAEYDQHEDVAVFWEQFLGRVRQLPGVTHAAGTIALPMGGGSPCAVLQVDPAPARTSDLGCPAYNIVTPGYFAAAGIDVRGREPTWSDIHTGTGAVVISASLANTLWPGEDPIGRGVRVPNGGEAWYRVVGVAADVRANGVREAPPSFVYYPIKQLSGAPLWQAQNALVVMVRTQTDAPEQLTASVRALLREMEPAAALGSVDTWNTVVARAMSSTTFTMVLLGTAGAMALLLAIVGLYGVIAYMVNRRRAEIGVRLALGADSGSIGRMVVVQSMALCAAGVTLGLFGALAATSSMRALLFEVEPTDPLTLTLVAALLLGVSALASFIPANRAARVSPVDALRTD